LLGSCLPSTYRSLSVIDCIVRKYSVFIVYGDNKLPDLLFIDTLVALPTPSLPAGISSCPILESRVKIVNYRPTKE